MQNLIAKIEALDTTKLIDVSDASGATVFDMVNYNRRRLIADVIKLVEAEQERIIKELQEHSRGVVAYGESPWDISQSPKMIYSDTAIKIVKGES